MTSIDGQSYSPRIHPEQTNLLYAYSTIPGYVSYRNHEKGSWFIQDFVRAINHLATPPSPEWDLQSILSRVTQDITAHALHGQYRQICMSKTTMTGKIYFH